MMGRATTDQDRESRWSQELLCVSGIRAMERIINPRNRSGDDGKR
jgi:hypothetical protein